MSLDQPTAQLEWERYCVSRIHLVACLIVGGICLILGGRLPALLHAAVLAAWVVCLGATVFVASMEERWRRRRNEATHDD